MRRVAILYAARGGFGDVGKFAAVAGLRDATMEPVVIALTAASEQAGNLFDVDVTDTSLRDDVRGALEGAEIKQIDVEAADAEEEIATAIDGCESVVACLGNRQGVLAGKLLGLEGLPLRWCAFGAEKVTSAMRAKSIRRLVVLSSFGIGDDFVPSSAIKKFWGFLLSTIMRSVKKDLVAMEAVVAGSELDYAIVRAVGLTPEEAPTGETKVLRKRGDGAVSIAVAKADAAKFMLAEALDATVHRAAVTIGH